MLSTDKQNATVTSVNVRAEQHGDRPVPACDIGIYFETGFEVLDEFEKGLKDAFYTDEKRKPKQARVPGTGEESPEGPRLRFNGALSALNIKKEWPGYKAGLIWGDLAGSVKIKLGDVKVAKIKAELKDGGTVGIALQLQCHPRPEAYGELATLIQRDGCTLTLEPPSVSELKKIEKDLAKAAEKKDGGPERHDDD